MADLKRILNLSEEATDLRLRRVCEQHGCRVFAKPRLADVLPIEGSGISNRDYGYALRAHLDFVVADATHLPRFAVEFDGPSHASAAQTERDVTKNRLLERFGLPLLRATQRHFESYRGKDILTWIIEVYFLQEAFYEAQEAGSIPPDEPFDPFWLFVPGEKRVFPHALAFDMRNRVRALHDKGRMSVSGPSHMIGRDKDDAHRAFGWLLVTAEVAAVSSLTMRRQAFPVSLYDLATEIVDFQTCALAIEIASGKSRGIPKRTLDHQINAFSKAYADEYGNVSGCFVSGPDVR